MDKAAWPPGPWQTEPDLALWTDAATGLRCLAARALLGVWNGYVAVPPGHPRWGITPEDPQTWQACAACAEVVHWGLTWSTSCATDLDVPADLCARLHGEAPAAHWWLLGFDCGHHNDLIPTPECAGLERCLSRHTRDFPALRRVYRDLAFVQAQCTALAQVLALPVLEEDAGG